MASNGVISFSKFQHYSLDDLTSAARMLQILFGKIHETIYLMHFFYSWFVTENIIFIITTKNHTLHFILQLFHSKQVPKESNIFVIKETNFFASKHIL